MSGDPEARPIFVRGLSRSGGTLTVTIIDSHPEVAMSYELYPNLLELEDGSPRGLAEVIDKLKPRRGPQFAAKVEQPQFATFLRRLPRGGLEPADVVKLLQAQIDDGLGVATSGERMRLVERCASWKAEREGKPRWGLKCLNDYDGYLEAFPAACFVNVVRDGRDVLASQIANLSGEREITKVARGWASTHRAFSKLQQRKGVCAHEINYERLVHDPEPELREMCEALGLAFDPVLLHHQDQDHSVYGASHVSMASIRRPINPSSIGRWRRELDPPQVDEFMRVAGEEMARLGYS